MSWKLPFILLLFFGVHAVDCSATVLPDVTFSEAVLAYNSAGKPYPAVVIDPENIEGMTRYRFDLKGGGILAIETNVQDPFHRRMLSVVESVRRCYAFVQAQTGRVMEANILLYLIEMDYLPQYYRFEAAYSGDIFRWHEVRLALVEKGRPLFGPNAPAGLMELLFDTLPHELGHDLLAGIPGLLHDIEGKPSCHTRWFIEGVCELLAKRFALLEVPNLWKQFISKRNVHSVLVDLQVRDRIFLWSQENSLPVFLESDLYGASLLLLIRWTESMSLKDILAGISQYIEPLNGRDLQLLLESSTGLTRNEIFDQASRLGVSLINLAMNLTRQVS